jgi:hypothetical protein
MRSIVGIMRVRFGNSELGGEKERRAKIHRGVPELRPISAEGDKRETKVQAKLKKRKQAHVSDIGQELRAT